MAENNQGSENRGKQGGKQGKQGGTSNRGFASMSPEQQREIASKGGHAAHQQGVAHEWTSEEAREAGRKGGHASHGGGRSSSQSNRGNQDNNQGNPEDLENRGDFRENF